MRNLETMVLIKTIINQLHNKGVDVIFECDPPHKQIPPASVVTFLTWKNDSFIFTLFLSDNDNHFCSAKNYVTGKIVRLAYIDNSDQFKEIINWLDNAEKSLLAIEEKYRSVSL